MDTNKSIFTAFQKKVLKTLVLVFAMCYNYTTKIWKKQDKNCCMEKL